uniref:F-box domain-containing protein n=1 Tax=Cacopsylla melanoneura TaxID=428564 RepID=A0A8D8ZJH7_9HEMI
MVMSIAYYLEDQNNDQDSVALQILSQLERQSKHDALAFIMYIQMLECGFTSEETNKTPTYNCRVVAEHIQHYESIITRKNNVYNIVLYVNKIKCNLDLLVFCNSLIANLSAPEYHILKSKSYKCIDVSNFEQIKILCLDFKNNIVMPVRTLALGHISIYSAGLIGLPYDVLVYLIKHYLKVQDFINIGRTCKALNYLIDDQTLWINFCKRENVNLGRDDGTPKTLFRQYLCSKKIFHNFNHFDVY